MKPIIYLGHLWAFWKGEDIDPETRLSHLASALFNISALLEYTETHPDLDDRHKLTRPPRPRKPRHLYKKSPS
jgi:hypothetical protein